MELLNELENLAAIAWDGTGNDDSIDPEMIQRWQHLFSYSEAEARDKIQRQRDDWTALVPVALWDTVKDKQEAMGHDRKSYSHWLQMSSRRQEKADAAPSISQAEREYLFRLEGPLDSPEQIARIAGLSRPPTIYQGESLSRGGSAKFCLVNSSTKTALQKWIAKEAPGFQPLFISHSRARKDLSSISILPFLGCESTLPQHRLSSSDTTPRPWHNEYPVWYFFYGNLADTATLERLFGHLDARHTSLELRPAQICGGKLETWGNGEYKALVDGEQDCVVHGCAFLVPSKEHEDALCYYETGVYEVVRCWIVFDGGRGGDGFEGAMVQGCTFRFVGIMD